MEWTLARDFVERELVEAIVEEKTDLIGTLAELASAPSLELLLLRRCNVIM
jgi:hypothetical protein